MQAFNRGSPSESEIFDVVIVGGGFVGSSLALALANLPLKIAVIEPYAQDNQSAPGFDARAIALSWGSTRIFKGIGLWQQLQNLATPIHKIHISDRGHFGISRLDAKQFNVTALGQVVELEAVGRVMHQALKATQTHLFCPAKVVQIQVTDDYSILSLDTENSPIKTRLVVAADGSHSMVRKLSNIVTETTSYGQTAIISTIQTQLPHNNVAYERFTQTGPVALLPLSENRISLVWMMQQAAAARLASGCDDNFIQQLQTQFGQRLGKITRTAERFTYPLNLIKAQQLVAKRLVLIGNAAQSLHPIAGQGFNLGLRDVATLADILYQSCVESLDPGAPELLQQYQNWRRPDQQKVIVFTDTIARLFANPSVLLSAPRNAMLQAMNLIPALGSEIAESAMGIRGRQPRLGRGLSLKLAEGKLDGA